jgi:solute carrier family 36 (proton-coupled amino acid transporter)
MKAFDETGFLTTVGFCIYAFEGIGVVMPIMQSSAEPKRFINLLYAAIATLTTIYIFFSVFCYCAYGYNLQPIVTENLPPAAATTIAIKFLFCLNLIFTYSITIAPANKILEHWLFSKCVPKNKRYWPVNFSRFFLCLIVIYIGLELASKIEKFLGLLGALCCAPLALTLPALLHYKALARTRSEKLFDLVLMIISMFILFFCTA